MLTMSCTFTVEQKAIATEQPWTRYEPVHSRVLSSPVLYQLSHQGSSAGRVESKANIGNATDLINTRTQNLHVYTCTYIYIYNQLQ